MKLTYLQNFSFIIIGFLFLSVPVQAQKNIDSLPQLQTDYQEYFALNRQQAFVHLNKTTFLPGEALWFAAYVYTFNKNLPSFNTTNLQVSLFNSAGKQLKTSTVYIENGKGYGNFELPTKSFPPGNYVLKAGTTYMKNFQEKSPFTQIFHITGKQKQQQADTTTTHYDLQLLPEGGHFLADATNNIGVKLIDDRGHGVLFTQGELKTTDGKLIRAFKSNRFGMSKFTFRPKPGKSYRVSLRTFDGKTISQALKKPENRGVNLIVTNLRDKVIFTLNTNQASIADISNQKFYLCGHQSGAMKTIEFKFRENSTSAQIQIKKDALFAGLNTITIFNQEFQPVLERLIFNRQGLKRRHVKGQFKKNEVDSLVLSLHSDSLEDSLQNSLSVSILPEKTNSYHPNQNLLSTFLLRPYLRGNFENGGYYFSSKESLRHRDYNLDLLLLTQGWSKYTWNRIFNHPPKAYFKPAHGFTISGGIKGRVPKRQDGVMISSFEQSPKLFEATPLLKNNLFKLEKAYVEDSTKLRISLINSKRAKASKPEVYLKITAPKPDRELKHFPDFQIDRVLGQETDLLTRSDFFKNRESLDGVLITVKKDNPKNPYEKQVSKEKLKSFGTLKDYLTARGFGVSSSIGGMAIYFRRKPAMVYLDGFRIYPGSSSSSDLNFLSTDEIESLTINKSGHGSGFNGANQSVIRIKRKLNYEKEPTYKTLIASNGFAKHKTFYTPKYDSYTSNGFVNYGVIGWKPNLKFTDGKATFKVQNTLQPNLRLFVEGMTQDGHLISEVISVDTQQ